MTSPAFLPPSPFSLSPLSPHPKLSRCPQPCYRISSSRRRVIIHSSSSLPDKPPSPEITSTKGFALRDARIYSYLELPNTPSKFSVAGAYAIRDATGRLSYVGYSRNVSEKLLFHQELVPEKCVSFQLYVPPVDPDVITPDMLENVLEYWVRENGGIPNGNTTDRALWENPDAVDKKSSTPSASSSNSAASSSATSNSEAEIPVRERTTPKRVANRNVYASPTADAFSDTFRASSGPTGRRRNPSGWNASDDDYVEVDVDPLDPFSASKRPATTRSSWDEEDDEFQLDWNPIIGIVGITGLLWFIGFLTNALPAATPSVGM